MESYKEQPEHEFEANGPDGLKETLAQIHQQALADTDFAAEKHTILYKNGDSRSTVIITPGVGDNPSHIAYQNHEGRPMTEGAKNAIGQFLLESSPKLKAQFNQEDGLKQFIKPNGAYTRYVGDDYNRVRQERFDATLYGVTQGLMFSSTSTESARKVSEMSLEDAKEHLKKPAKK